MAQTVKNPSAMRRPRLIPGSVKSPGEEHVKPLQYYCLGNSMDRGTWKALVHGVATNPMTEQLTLSLRFTSLGMKTNLGWLILRSRRIRRDVCPFL